MTEKYVDDLLNRLSSLKVSKDSKKSDGDDNDVDDKSEKLYSLKFKKELDKTKFTIFVPIADCGYYGWNPLNETPQSLSDVQSADDITRHIDIHQKPKKLLPLSQLKVPCSFDMSLPPDEHPNKYPFGQYDVASLYVASKYRDVELNEIDFIFGGSTLEMLAKHDVSNPYMVCRIPTTKTNHTLLLVRKCKEYTQNFADIGFQFERYVTTGSMHRNDSIEFLEHMQVMEIGTPKFKVLLCAETDAIDDDDDDGTDNDNPMEIKASNPQYWGTKVMFQMISSGSPVVCCGIKGRNNTLTNITMRSLSMVAADALRNSSYQTLERNIVNGMQALLHQMKDVQDHESYKISFKSNGELSLQHAITRNAIMLPPEKVVKVLLDLK
jgi:hypothetical protein